MINRTQARMLASWFAGLACLTVLAVVTIARHHRNPAGPYRFGEVITSAGIPAGPVLFAAGCILMAAPVIIYARRVRREAREERGYW